MSDLYERLRATLPDATFAPPATEQEIVQVEQELGNKFPEWLRQLYLCCNGIRSHKFNDPYLWSLHSDGEERNSLFSWNCFLRDNCDQFKESYDKTPEGIESWEKTHAKNFLTIGFENGVNWAINIKTGNAQIVWYDERNPDDDYFVLGEDLADTCAKHEAQMREIHTKLFRGRQPVRREIDPLPPSNDIELILDTLIELHRGTKAMSMSIREAFSPSGSLYRGISQRPGERGVLFILSLTSTEIQFVTRDGNLPFIIRFKPPLLNDPFQCLVKDLPEALLCVLYLVDLIRGKNLEDSTGYHVLADQINRVWRHRYGPADPELESMAEILFQHDDNRLVEDNRLGA